MSEISQERPKEEILLADPAPAMTRDGIDLTLIRWMLSLTPWERLQVLQRHIEAIRRLRDVKPQL
jgi:hypothetical protein